MCVIGCESTRCYPKPPLPLPTQECEFVPPSEFSGLSEADGPPPCSVLAPGQWASTGLTKGLQDGGTQYNMSSQADIANE